MLYQYCLALLHERSHTLVAHNEQIPLLHVHHLVPERHAAGTAPASKQGERGLHLATASPEQIELSPTKEHSLSNKVLTA